MVILMLDDSGIHSIKFSCLFFKIFIQRTAEIIEKYAGKGKEIGVSGKLKSRSYEDNEGVKRYVTEVEANEILLLGARNDDSVR